MKKTTDLLYETNMKILTMLSILRQNPILDEQFKIDELEALQEKISDHWRELMKSV